METEEKVNILLVDDDPSKMLALENILSGLGQNLVKAHSGKEALRALLDRDFAVVLLDVRMPVMDGFETAAIMREREKLAHLPIIFVTASDGSETHLAQGYSLGAVDYIYTPIVPEILRAKVSVFVELKLQQERMGRLEQQRGDGRQLQPAGFGQMESKVHRRIGALRHTPVSRVDQNNFNRQQRKRRQQRPLKQRRVERDPAQFHVRLFKSINFVVDARQLRAVHGAIAAPVRDLRHFVEHLVIRRLQRDGGDDFTLRIQDVTTIGDADLVDTLPSSPSYVFDLASPASVVDYLRLPLETLRVNSIAPFRMARAFKANLLSGHDKKLVVITSKMGSISDSSGGSIAYRASKAALNMIMHAIAKEWAPKIAAQGCLVIDNSSAWRMDRDVPLVVPEVNAAALDGPIKKRIIANPNCSTAQLVVALKPLHDEAVIKRCVVATYQSVSGAGKEAMDELFRQTRSVFVADSMEVHCFTKQIAFNVIPHIDVFLDSGYTKEEWKMMVEVQKILDPDIQVTATCVRPSTCMVVTDGRQHRVIALSVSASRLQK